VADYHCSVKTVSRSAGRSATAAAAYRAAEKIVDQRTGLTHDYTRKTGVVLAELVLPAGAPEWAGSREELWNAAEAAEKRKNSTVAREFEIALPCELDDQQRAALAHKFARELVKKHGFAADVCIHRPGVGGDKRNHHAHILTTTRRLTADGFTEKCRELDAKATGPALVVAWRERLAELTNEALAAAGHSARVDHRSHAARGLDTEPTIKLGSAASALERKAQAAAAASGQQYQPATERGRINAAIQQRNANVISIADKLSAVEQKIRAERLAAAAQVRQRWFNKTPAEVQARLAQLTNPAAYVAADPAEQANRHAYTRAVQRRNNCRQWRNVCATDLAALQKKHPVAVVAMAAGLRPAAANVIARARAELAAAEVKLAAAQRAVQQLATKGKALVKALQQQYAATPAARRAEHDALTKMLAEPDYQAAARAREQRLEQRAEQSAAARAAQQQQRAERLGHGPDETRDEALRRQAAEQQQQAERERQAAAERAKLAREARQTSAARRKSKSMGM